MCFDLWLQGFHYMVLDSTDFGISEADHDGIGTCDGGSHSPDCGQEAGLDITFKAMPQGPNSSS
jgi:hypothetical protein